MSSVLRNVLCVTHRTAQKGGWYWIRRTWSLRDVARAWEGRSKGLIDRLSLVSAYTARGSSVRQRKRTHAVSILGIPERVKRLFQYTPVIQHARFLIALKSVSERSFRPNSLFNSWGFLNSALFTRLEICDCVGQEEAKSFASLAAIWEQRGWHTGENNEQ